MTVDDATMHKLQHLFAGGVGATVGQCVTCPLDVVQTRLQSSKLNFSNVSQFNAVIGNSAMTLQVQRPTIGIGYFQMLFTYMKHMVTTEGYASLFKGLSPSLFGIVPAKSVYFFCYANAKNYLKNSGHFTDQHSINSLSAVTSGTITGTVTNPVWYIKTKLQLNRKHKPSVLTIVRTGYAKHGVRCFFRGLSASYVGVLETVIYFVLYEDLKQILGVGNNQFSAINLMTAALLAKVSATMIMYPHEVVRVRLREDKCDPNGQLKYRNFVQTLMRVAREEGRPGMYGGFGTNLLRQLPNTASTFLAYEAVVHLFYKYYGDKHS